MTKRPILGAVLGLLVFSDATLAQSEVKRPQFVPYTITEQAHQDIMNYLGDLPAKYANPLLKAFADMAQRAAVQKPPPNKPTPQD